MQPRASLGEGRTSEPSARPLGEGKNPDSCSRLEPSYFRSSCRHLSLTTCTLPGSSPDDTAPAQSLLPTGLLSRVCSSHPKPSPTRTPCQGPQLTPRPCSQLGPSPGMAAPAWGCSQLSSSTGAAAPTWSLLPIKLLYRSHSFCLDPAHDWAPPQGPQLPPGAC